MWSDVVLCAPMRSHVVRCSPMWSDVVISYALTPTFTRDLLPINSFNSILSILLSSFDHSAIINHRHCDHSHSSDVCTSARECDH